jgi:hypothetical protein
MIYSIELDLDHEMTIGELANLINPHNLIADIVDLSGPTSGNPVIEVYGNYLDIVMFLAEYTEGCTYDLKFLVERIK